MFRTIKEILGLFMMLPVKVQTKGWVKFYRKQGKRVFLTLSDGSCQQTLQVIAEKDQITDPVTFGQAVYVCGTLVESPAPGQLVEIQMDSYKVFPQKADYPLAKARPSLEHLRTIQHMRPKMPLFQAIARIRHAAMMGLHFFFDQQGFQCIHTPIITSSDCEGAGEAFHVMSTEELKSRCDGKEVTKFFRDDAYLTVSGQLHVETYALALGKVYTMGPTFRAEHSNTSRHLAEFWMMEPEMICDSLDELLKLTEQQIHYCVDYVLDHCGEEIEFIQSTHSPKLIQQIETMRRKFVRITYTDAITSLQEAKEREPDLVFDAPEWGDDLSSDMEKYLVDALDAVVIVTHYPKSLKSFYMKDTPDCQDDKATVECMDILVPGVGELVGGSMREDDYDVLIGKMKEKGMDLSLYEWYTDTRKWGSIPHGGYGMGFERFLMAMTGMQVKDLIPFFRSYTQLAM